PSVRSWAKKHLHGVGRPRLGLKVIRQIPVVLPPLDEQQRILEILEDHVSRLDAANGLTETAEKRLRAWQRGSLDSLVHDDADGAIRLGSLIEQVEAGRSFGGSASPAASHEWGIIKVSAMTWGEFRQDENKAVPADRVDPRYEIRAGDLLVSRANTTAYVGAPVLVEKTRRRLLLSDKSLRLVPKSGIDARWLAAVLAAPSTRSQVSALATGTKDSMRNISQQSLLLVSVPRATPAQQTRVVARVSDLRSSGSHLGNQLTVSRVRSLALRRSLLTAAFSGRLSGRSTDAEITEELSGV
ncbi:MAG: restriction endonuclease subunit S, partial [Pseudonocardiaceae bacterium]